MKRIILGFVANYKGTIKKILAYGNYYTAFRIVKRDGKRMQKPCHEEPFYDAMTFDINNTCNLRCQFCFNNFEKKGCYMSEEVYRKILTLFPLIRPLKARGQGILFSCLYEPSIAPNFLKFLKMLPASGRKNVFFTSNFCRTMTEEEIRTIFSANIRHVNLSVETLRPERYQEICSSIQFESFYANLEKIAKLNAQHHMGTHWARLYCVTMVLKANRDELSAIGRFCSEKLKAARHDFRTPFISDMSNNWDWNKRQFMDAAECGQVSRELMELHVPITLDIHSREELPSHSNERDHQAEETNAAAVDTVQNRDVMEERLEELRFCMSKEFLFLRFHPSGLCTSDPAGEEVSIADMEDSSGFFKNRLIHLYRRRADAFLVPDGVFASLKTTDVKEISARVMFYRMRSNPVYLHLEGWIRIPEIPEDFLLFATVKGKAGGKQMFLALEQPCWEWLHDQDAHFYDFTLCLAWDKIERPVCDLTFLIVAKKDLTPIYQYRYPYGIL